MMFARKKCEHCAGLDVVICVVGVLIECEAWLTWTGSISGLSGSDIILCSRVDSQDSK